MTLRFFGRKGAKARTTREEPPTDTPKDKTDNEPARRAVRRTTKPPETSTSSAPPSDAPANGGPKTTRSRRGRRGGVGRKKKPPVDAAPQEQPEKVQPARGRSAPSRPKPATTVNGAIDIDGASLAELMQRQLEALKSVQSSLSSIENRLTTGIGVGAGTDRPRLGIFVDVPNVMYAAERQKVKIDYGKLLEFLTRGRELVRASAYSPISDETGERFDAQRFVQPFANMGYRIVTKPHKRYADGSMKANFDVELALDVMVMSDRLDVVSLVSGDGDFRRLVELVAGKGVRVEVVAFSQSTAQELRAVADQYIDLNDYLSVLKA